MSGYRPLAAVVLAAGEGTRMRSELPKVLHPLCGRPMLLHVVDALVALPLERIVIVVGHGAERVTKTLQEQIASEMPIEFVEQRVQRGTGDAVSVGLTAFSDDPDLDGDVLVMPGDAPLVRPEVLARLARDHREADAAATLLTADLDELTRDFGRLVRDDKGRADHIVEKTDASPEELEIDEVNTSIYCFRRSVLAPALRRLSPENTQGEYYLTDVIAVLHDAGYGVGSLVAEDPAETQGVNDRAQLAAAEKELRRRTNLDWLRRGVTMVDPDCTYVDTTVRLAADVTLFPGTILQGETVIGERAEIGPDTRLVDCLVGADAVVDKSSGRDAEIGDGARVGPFAVLDPGSVIPAGAVTGPFYAARSD
jgi:bifunctional UDP-N-acetylglucosamine pyrophosphorylase/glucosamine-1-phosphate N-acetyltransferase